MWNDIHNNADRLSENKIVKSLASGKLEWETDGLPTTSDLDGSYLPSEIALPISADATQLDAICAAAQNKSFILHGPTGTGKSQTITNIIANALYQGKKVLFVAEKMAALEHATDQIPLNKELIEQLSKDQYIAYTDKVEELQNAGSLCTHPHQHPLAQISLCSYNQSAKTQAQEAIAQYHQVLSRKIETTKELCGLLLLNDTPLNKAKTKQLASLSQHLVSLPDSPPTLLNIDHPERQLAQILELTDHGQKRDSHRDTKVTNVYVPGYYDRGKTRQNHFEAKAVVAEVVKRLAEAKRSHIQSSRTSSEGVAGIKAFLQYSEKGDAALKFMQLTSLIFDSCN